MDFVAETQSLYQRFEKSQAFQGYVRERLHLIIPVLAMFLVFSLCITAGTVLYVGGTRSLLVLLTLICAPFILIGSLLVELFVFFWWLEWRAIDRLTGHAPKPPAGMPKSLGDVRALLGRPPAVPWTLAAIFVLAPFLALAALSLKTAAVLFFAALLTPFLYSHFDR